MSNADKAKVGADALAAKGWLGAHKWLLMRRFTQLAILALFLLGPLAGVWIVKGNLSYSLTLDTLPLADPFVLLQSVLAGNVPEKLALIGVAIVVAFYFVVGGRVYCSWVCPVNMVTDTAAWLRRRLGIKEGARLSRNTRYWMLAMTLVLAAATGAVAWELVNPVSMLHRGLIFGIGMAWAIVLAIFLFDLFVMNRGWCAHVCPMGAFYSLIGKRSVIRISAVKRSACNDCMDCYKVCPEPQVISPALNGEKKGVGPVILSGSCTNCARCIDVCSKDVFKFGMCFNNQVNEKLGDQALAVNDKKH
ncbi:quinol dehydrogenase ferredoxin subunit NapH [Noviherbaspirillum agri]